MELVSSQNCILCNDSGVLKSVDVAPFFKYVGNTFFAYNKKTLNEFQNITTGQSLCIMCANKAVISYKLKDTYESALRQSSRNKKLGMYCIICNAKTVDLFSTEGNPNDCNTKIKTFMDATVYSKSNSQSAVCMDCFFYLNMWFDVYLNLSKIISCMNDNTQINGHSNERLNNDKQDLLKSNSENSCDDRKSKCSTTSKKLSLSLSKPPLEDECIELTDGDDSDINSVSVQKSLLQHIFKTKLKHLKSIKQINSRKIRKNITSDDDKLINKILYVLIPKNEDLEERLHGELKESEDLNDEIIELSDSDYNDEILNTSTDAIYACHICDQDFSSCYEYKAHFLWHEKPEILKVDLVRNDLPLYANASVFLKNEPVSESSKKSDTGLIFDKALNTLVSKYIGETDVFEESNHNNGENPIDNISRLDSPVSTETFKVIEKDKEECNVANSIQNNDNNEISNVSNETNENQDKETEEITSNNENKNENEIEDAMPHEVEELQEEEDILTKEQSWEVDSVTISNAVDEAGIDEEFSRILEEKDTINEGESDNGSVCSEGVCQENTENLPDVNELPPNKSNDTDIEKALAKLHGETTGRLESEHISKEQHSLEQSDNDAKIIQVDESRAAENNCKKDVPLLSENCEIRTNRKRRLMSIAVDDKQDENTDDEDVGVPESKRMKLDLNMSSINSTCEVV